MSGGYFSSIFASSCGVFSSPPVISGSATEGTTLTGTDATGYGIVTSRKWQRSYDNVTWIDIPSATSSTYVLKYEDVGNYVRFTNVADSTVSSSAVGTVTAITVPPTTPASPVTGDILSVSIETLTNGNGKKTYALVTIKGFATGASYAFGWGAKNDPTNCKFVMDVFSEGFDSQGNLKVIQRRLRGSMVMRKAFPNEAQLDEAASGSDLVVKVALNNVVYDDDKNGGAGTSGRNPIVSIAAGWCTNTGGGGQSSRAAYLSCTNNSTSDYRTPFGQWAQVNEQRVTSDFTVGFTPRHAHGISCCVLDAVGASSGNSLSVKSTAMAARQRAVSQLYHEANEATFAVAGFTQGEQINLRARAYPSIGDTAFDTNANTNALLEYRGANAGHLLCDKSNTPNLAVVSSSGNDGTGVTSTTEATAAASPFLTIGKACQALGTGGGLVLLENGTHDMVGSEPAARVANAAWITVKPRSGSKSTVNVLMTTHSYKVARLRYYDVRIKLGATNAFLDGDNAGNLLWWDYCHLDQNGFTTIVPPTYRSNCLFLTGCTGQNDCLTAMFVMGSFSSDRAAVWVDGCSFAFTSVGSGSAFGRIVASKFTGGFNATQMAAVNPLGPQDNLLLEFNQFMNHGGAGTPAIGPLNQNASLRYVSFSGNIVERTGTTQVAVSIGEYPTDMDDVVYEGNTVVGERSNVAYNDSGSVAYSRQGWSRKNNAERNFCTKHDDFTGNGGGNGNRIGGWPVLYGQNQEGNVCETSLFPELFNGIGSTDAGTPAFTNDASYTGTATGNGNYAPAAGSDLLNNRVAGQLQFDLFGNAVAAGGEVGAVQV